MIKKLKSIISSLKDWYTAHVRPQFTPERMRAASELVRTAVTFLEQGPWS